MRMTRGPLAGIALCALIGPLAGRGDARPTRRLEVASDPAGATVYVDDVDAGAACDATPCTIEAPIGASSLIIRKDGFLASVTEVTVPKKGKVKAFKVTLNAATAKIIITDKPLTGGKIVLDGTDKGVAPQTLVVDASSHTVQVFVKGKKLAEALLDLEAGDEKEVKADAATRIATAPALGALGALGGGAGDDPDETKPIEVVNHPAEPPSDRGPYIAVGADLEVGFRQFKYDNPANGLARDEKEGGQSLLGPAIELWPSPRGRLRGLSLYGKLEFALNSIPVLDSTKQSVGASTYWGDLEIDLRHRWHVGEASSVTLSAGFVRDQMTYNVASKMQLAQLPVVDYRSVRIGVRAATAAGPFEPFVEAEARIVYSGGDLGTRFASHDTSGYHAAVGAQLVKGPVFLRAQAALTYYSWTFTNAGSDPAAGTADGATDLVEMLSFVLGVSK
ncbi:hypothetical protein BH11MYX1_BH11MYX1_14240 [soil metagenome]